MTGAVARRAVLAVVMGASAGLISVPAGAQGAPTEAQTKQLARNLAQEGAEAYQKADYPTALDRFDRAYRLLRAPTLGLWSARALEKSGKLVEASERYTEVERMALAPDAPDAFREAQADAARENATLGPRIPKLTIAVQGATTSDVMIKVDGKLLTDAFVGVAVPMNPGPHDVEGQLGQQTERGSATLTEGATASVTLTFDSAVAAPVVTPVPVAAPRPAAPLAPEPAPPPEPAVAPAADEPSSLQSTLGWVGLGIGTAAVAGGAVTYFIGRGAKDTLDERCTGQRCPPSVHGEVDTFDSMKTLSPVLFIAGGVFAGAGLTLLVTAPDDATEDAQLTLRLHTNGATLRGTF